MPFTDFTAKSTPQIFTDLHTSETGLTAAEVVGRQKHYGLNRLEAHEVHWWQILLRQLTSPFLYLLAAATGLSFALGERTDGIIIICFVIINTVLGFLEEFHSEHSLKLLKKYVIQQARVRRGSHDERIASEQIVPGDIIIIEAGDMLPADIRFIETTDLLADEAALTGESVPIAKQATALPEPAQAVHEALNCGFSGTTIVSGRGVGVVFATGSHTQIGDISKLTVETHRTSGFEKGIAKFSSFILKMILVILVLLFIVNLLIKGPGQNIFELLLFSIALAVSVVPEALPVVTTIALAKGAAELAKHKVVVKRLSAVEDLGSIEVLCSDKTGTLTENKLTVHNTQAKDTAECLLLATLASSVLGEIKHQVNNAFDVALWEKLSPAEQARLAEYAKISELPFDPSRRRNSVLVKNAAGCTLIVRGATEVVIALCAELSAATRSEIMSWTASEGRAGCRVIAVAKKTSPANTTGHCSTDEHGLTFVGLISFVDPIKTTAKHAIEQAKKLGVRIKILTGDGPEVAGAVAQTVGLITDPANVITGAALMALAPANQLAAVAEHAVFARVSPAEKYKIIELLEKKYEVGFLGEGINDAPALKIAGVGIVVADAADIARDAADIVLLKRSLTVIVDGIREGREIFANTVKYIKATLISNFGNFYAIAVASLLIPYLPMLPVQILLLNLLSDFPMIAIATDTVDKLELRRPKSYEVKDVVLIAVILGAVSTIFDFIFFGLFFRHNPAVLQTNWFIGSVLTELVLIFSIRARGFFLKARLPGLALTGLSATAFVAALVIPVTAFGHRIFGFDMPSNMHLLQILLVVCAYFITTEIIKLLYYRHTNQLSTHNHHSGKTKVTLAHQN